MDINVANDGQGPVPIFYEALDGNADAMEATIHIMENLKQHLKIDRTLRVSDRGCFSTKVAIKTVQGGFDFVSSIRLDESYEKLFLDCLDKGIGWKQLSYLSIAQQAKPESERDHYYGYEIQRELVYGQSRLTIRVIFIKSDGKLRRDEKSCNKKLQRIDAGLEDINNKIGRPHYRTENELVKRVEAVLNKYSDLHPRSGFQVDIVAGRSTSA